MQESQKECVLRSHIPCRKWHELSSQLGVVESPAGVLQTARIIKTAAAKPQQRKTWIESCVKNRAQLPDDPTLMAFRMSVEPDMVDVLGRHLLPPQLFYNDRNIAR